MFRSVRKYSNKPFYFQHNNNKFKILDCYPTNLHSFLRQPFGLLQSAIVQFWVINENQRPRYKK